MRLSKDTEFGATPRLEIQVKQARTTWGREFIYGMNVLRFSVARPKSYHREMWLDERHLGDLLVLLGFEG